MNRIYKLVWNRVRNCYVLLLNWQKVTEGIMGTSLESLAE